MEPTTTNELAAAVAHLAAATHDMSDADLGQPFRWGAHQEGARFALLGAMHELRALAVHLAAERRRAGPHLSRAHHALAQYQAAYRDLEAALLGVSEEAYDQPPANGEWPLRYVYAHMVSSERHFVALAHYGLRRQREGGDLSAELPDGETERLFGPREALANLMETGTRQDMAAYHTNLHDRALDELAGISDREIDGPSLWWEGEPYTLEYRLHRMDAHLRQHTVQVDRTRDQLGQPVTEARRLLRLVYGALAEVEGAIIGTAGLGAAECAAAAGNIRKLADDAAAAVGRANAFIAAVMGGDRAKVAHMLAEDGTLANATSRDGVPAARLAIYYAQESIAETLGGAPGLELAIWDAAALGRLEAVEAIHRDEGDYTLNEYSRDGYTPLQLACFFGREDVARYLVAKGAAVDAVSRNPMAIQPLHAAVAGNHQRIVGLLLASGADPNAEQQDGFRPLHAAAQNGSGDLVRALLAAGADPSLTDAQGRTPRELAAAAGHGEVAALLG